MSVKLEEYKKYLRRLNKAFEYNNEKPIKEDSKFFKAYMDIVENLRELEDVLGKEVVSECIKEVKYEGKL